MKKLSVLLAALLVILSFAACSQKPETPVTTVPVIDNGAVTTLPDATEAPASETAAGETAAPVEAALIPGDLYQLDAASPVLRGLCLAGNRAGVGEFNTYEPTDKGIRCIFELNEWVEVYPDPDNVASLAVWVFAHRDDPTEYAGIVLSEETEGYAAFCDLPAAPEDQEGAPAGSFYLHPDECEPGFYDFVFTVNGKPSAVLLTKFYDVDELCPKSDDELVEIMNGLK